MMRKNDKSVKFREDMNKVLDCRGVVYLDIAENCCQIPLVV
jgi:hypothetical protein